MTARPSPYRGPAILVSAILVLSCGQTDRIRDADDRYTHTTTIGVSKYSTVN